MSSGNETNRKRQAALRPPNSDSNLPAPKAIDPWTASGTTGPEAASLLSKLLSTANETSSFFEPPAGSDYLSKLAHASPKFGPPDGLDCLKWAQPANHGFEVLKKLTESYAQPQLTFEPPAGLSDWLKAQADYVSPLDSLNKCVESYLPSNFDIEPPVWLKLAPPTDFVSPFESLNKYDESYLPPNFDTEKPSWLKLVPPADNAFDSIHKLGEPAANTIFSGPLNSLAQAAEGKTVGFGGNSLFGGYLQGKTKMAEKSDAAPSAPYLRSAAVPQIEQATERLPAPEAKGKVLPVNPSVETNKLLRDLIQQSKDAREEAAQERKENRKLAGENAELRERVAKLEAKAAVGESHQLSLEGKIDEAMTILKVMHCNVETVAAFSKDVRESLGGPPLNNLPPLESQDEDKADENESDYD